MLMIAGVDGGVFASAAKEADEAFTNPRCSILYDALTLTATAREYYSDLQGVLQRGYEDDLVDSHLALTSEP